MARLVTFIAAVSVVFIALAPAVYTYASLA